MRSGNAGVIKDRMYVHQVVIRYVFVEPLRKGPRILKGRSELYGKEYCRQVFVSSNRPALRPARPVLREQIVVSARQQNVETFGRQRSTHWNNGLTRPARSFRNGRNDMQYFQGIQCCFAVPKA